MNSQEDDVPIFQASDDRRTIVVKKVQRISHPNQIPDDILNDELLSSLISKSLPKNYNFEIHKTVWKIKQTEAKRILLQFPEGLIRFGPVIVDLITAYFEHHGQNDINFITMGDLTYGACCIDDYLASSMGCHLIIHYAHSCLVPINQLNKSIKYLYVFLDIKFDLEHVVNCVRHNFQSDTHKIALASTIQFVASAHEIARQLRNSGFDITLPQSRPLSSAEVLGCTAPKLDDKINTILFVCDGRFHLEALMIANPKVSAYRYDPYSRKLTREAYSFDEMYSQRMDAISKSVQVMKTGGTFGFVLGTLGRQGNEKVYDRMIERLKKHSSCKCIKVLLPEVVHNTLQAFKSIDIWVQIACPRLSIDWGASFTTPLLNPYEFAQSIKLLKNQNDNLDAKVEKAYPMDFYAKCSRYDHTPNHSCMSNPNCDCASLV